MTNTLSKLLLKQHYTGYWVGAVRQLFSSAQFYLGFINFGMIAILAYDGSFGQTLKTWLPWLNFTWYVSFFVIGYLLVCLFEWKIVFPSNVALSAQQGYQSQSRQRWDIKQVHNELLDVREQLIKLGADPIEKKEGLGAAWSDSIDRWQDKTLGGGW